MTATTIATIDADPRNGCPVAAPAASCPLAAGDLIPAAAFARVRRRMLLDGCKWDPQVGDVATLAPFPLFIRRRDWHTLATDAEQLAAELNAAEFELLERPDLWHRLGIPRRLRRVLRRTGDTPPPRGVRSLRFDFHWTGEGWRISEVNSDVPGGYAEASAFPQLVAAQFADRDVRPVGNPAEVWADAMEHALGVNARNVALVTAPGFMEDHQVAAYLARTLAARGFTPHLIDARGLAWHGDGTASLSGVPLAAVVRFYQGEWLSRLPRGAWEPLFCSRGSTLVTNPGAAVLTESKRFPLTWPELQTALPTWRKLLPETRDPRDVPWRRDADEWILKSAFCNTGDTVAAADLVPPKHWRAAKWSARLFPSGWIAQRRFRTLPVDTPVGDAMYPCVGVYTVNGRAAGAYVRLSRGPVCDYRAVDAALLLRGGDDDADIGGES